MYYILKNNLFLEPEIGLYEPKDFPSNLFFINGSFITASLDNPLVFTTNAKAGDKMIDFQASSFPIMSKLFVEIIERAGVDNLQKFPVIIKSQEDETIWNNYFLVNILGMVSCADLSKSTFDEIMPGHYIFEELAIHPEKAGGALLFRLLEHSPTIIMHRSVGQYIKSQDPDKNLVGWSVGKIIQ